MRSASIEAQKYAQNINTAASALGDATTYQKEFADAQHATLVSQIAANHSLSETSVLINEFNAGTFGACASQEEFLTAIGTSNHALAQYLTSVDAGSASLWGFVKSQIAANAAIVGVKALTIGLNMGLTMLISAGISLAIKGFKALGEAIKEALKTPDEKLSDLRKNFEDLQSQVATTAKDFRSLNKSFQETVPRFVELYQKYGNLGEQNSETNEEYAEFVELNNKIAEMFPQLVVGYDDNGTAMLALSQSADTLTASLNDLLEAERKLSQQEMADTFPDVFSNVVDTKKQLEKKAQGIRDAIDDLEHGFDIFAEHCFDIFADHSTFYYADPWYWKVFFQQIGLSDEDFENVAGELKFDADKVARAYENTIAGLERRLEEVSEQLTSNGNKLTPVIQAWLSTDINYNKLNNDMQRAVTNIVSGIDFSDYETEYAVKRYISDNIIAPIQGMEEEVQDELSELLKLDTSDKSVSEYMLEAWKLAGDIAEKSGYVFNPLEILSFTLHQDKIEQLEDAAKQITDIFAEGFQGKYEDLYDEILSLPANDITRALNLVKKYGIKTIGELREALAKGTYDAAFDFSKESESFSKLNTALSESASATGLTADSVAELTKRYGELEGFDAATLFEYTANGIHLNANALSELEAQYEATNKQMLHDKLELLVKKYKELAAEIAATTDEQKRAELIARSKGILTEIKNTETLTSQYLGLTSAYNKWIQAKNKTDERATYQNVGESYAGIKDLIDQGWVSDSEITEYLDLLLAADKRTKDNAKDFAKLTQTIEGTNYSLMDFWQVDENGKLVTDGLYMMLDAVHQLFGDSYVQLDENGMAKSFDFAGDRVQQVADALGTSVEMVRLFSHALSEAGFDAKFDSLIKEDVSDLSGEVEINVNSDPFDFWYENTFKSLDLSKTATITYVEVFKPSGDGSTTRIGVAGGGKSEAYGTAYARGYWGAQDSGIALGGELGPELVVRNGHFFTVGDKSAELFNYRRGDIIFNADQTREILKYGRIISSRNRGSAYLWGTAFDSGNTITPVGYHTNTRPIYADPSKSSGSGSSGGSSSKSSGEEDNWFVKQYKLNNHLINMCQEDMQDYLDWLAWAFPKAYDEGLFELDEYREYQEELFSKLQDSFKDYLSDVEHEIDMRSQFEGETKNILSLYKQLMGDIEKEVAAARAQGLNDNDEYIQTLQQKHKSLSESVKNIEEETLKAAKDATDKLIDYRQKMLKQEISDEKDGLKKKLDNLKDFYDKQKEMLKDARDEEKYLDEQAEKRQSVTDIQAQLAQLEYDNSAWAQKRKAELRKQLADAQKELTDFEKDHALDETLNFLEKSYNAQEEQINSEMEKLDNLLNDPEALYNRALADISGDTSKLYQEMLEYNRRHGTGNDADVESEYGEAYAALLRYHDLNGEWYGGVQLPNATGYTPGTGSWNTETISGYKNPTTVGKQTPDRTYGMTGSGGTSSSGGGGKPNDGSVQKDDETVDDVKTTEKAAAQAVKDAIQATQAISGVTEKFAKLFGGSVDEAKNIKTWDEVVEEAEKEGRIIVQVPTPEEAAAAKRGKVVGTGTAKVKLKGHASGTKSAAPGLSMVDELGPEWLFTSSSGDRYRIFSGGEKVLNAKATEFLYNFANNGGEVLSRLFQSLVSGGSVGSLQPSVISNEIHMGDIVVQGNANQATVSEIRRAQRESVNMMLREFNRLNK